MNPVRYEGGMGRDGFEIRSGVFIIHQRAGKGDKIIPTKNITEVKASYGNKITGLLDRNNSLMVAAGGKRYVLRRMPRAVVHDAEAALITEITAREGESHSARL